jgi:hypothetical protein
MALSAYSMALPTEAADRAGFFLNVKGTLNLSALKGEDS